VKMRVHVRYFRRMSHGVSGVTSVSALLAVFHLADMLYGEPTRSKSLRLSSPIQNHGDYRQNVGFRLTAQQHQRGFTMQGGKEYYTISSWAYKVGQITIWELKTERAVRTISI
jgi:hypothetical protein